MGWGREVFSKPRGCLSRFELEPGIAMLEPEWFRLEPPVEEGFPQIPHQFRRLIAQ